MKKVEGLEVKSNFIPLPSFKTKGEVSLEEAILGRRSKWDFLDRPLNLTQLSQILWAGQGITAEKWGIKLRSAPSAGALYPLEIYIVVGEDGVETLTAGIYHYLPPKHAIEMNQSGDVRRDLAKAALGQHPIAEAPISIVIAAEYERTTGRYGERGIRYVHMEVGHVGENIYLQAKVLGLGTVAICAFYDEEVIQVLNLPPNRQPLSIMPIGSPR